MPRFPFIGGTYSAYSEVLNGERSINLFPEVTESAHGRSAIALYGTPGLEIFAELPAGLVRAMHTEPRQIPSSDRVFAVAGDTFYEVFSDGTYDDLGTVADDTYPAYIASNGTQLAIASFQNLYIFNLTTGVFSGPILFDQDTEAVTAISVVFSHGYFLANTGAQKIYFSNLYDGLIWDALSFFSAESNPDNCLRLVADHAEVWAFGDSSIQVYAATGDADIPFAPIPGAFMEQGLWAPDSVIKLDNSVFWLGGDERGKNIVWRANGWTAQRISTHAIENQLRQLPSTVFARGWCYTDFGHAFYCLTIPNENSGQTLVYDASTNLWHERGCWNQRLGQFDAHHGWNHVWGFSKHLVGDRGGTCCVTTTTSCPEDNGALLTGAWTMNSRVGPFVTERLTSTFNAKVWGVFRDPNNAKRLIVQYRPSGSIPWLVVSDTFTALTNNILSHDVHQDNFTDRTVLHIATQEETTGRVSYHSYSLTTNTWTRQSVTLSAAQTIITGGVSVTVRSGGNIIVYAETSKENVGAADRYRCGYWESSDGGATWGSLVDIGRTGEPQSSGIARAVADHDNRVHFFMRVSPGFFVSATQDLEVRTLRANNTLSSIVTWYFTGLSSTTPRFYMGDPAIFIQDGVKRLAIPIKRNGAANIILFDQDDTLALTPLWDEFLPGDPLIEESSLGAQFSMFTVRAINGELHGAFLPRVFSSDVWATYKSGGYAGWDPATVTGDQAGPSMTVSEVGREFGAEFFSCHEGLHLATFTKLASGAVMFNMVSTANLPYASGYNLAAWMSEWG